MKRFLVLFCLVISLLWIGGNQGVAINTRITAPILVDGEVIFDIGPINHFTATQRAKLINQMIAETIRNSATIKLSVNQVEDIGVIQSQEGVLMTVTSSDVINGVDVVDQARLWGDLLEDAIAKAQLARSPQLFWRRLWFSLGAVFLALILSLGWIGLIVRKFKRSPMGLYFIPLGFWLLVIIYLSNLFPGLRSWRYQLFSLLTQSSLGGLSVLGFLLFLGTWLIYSVCLHIYLNKRLQKNHLSIVINLVGNLLGLLFIAQLWGLDLSLMFLGIGVFLLAIATVFAKLNHNFSSGLVIQWEQSPQVGDLIQIDNLVGTVLDIGLISTEISTLDHTRISIPNHRLLETTLINWTKVENTPIRLSIPVSISYGTDLKKVKAALLESVRSYPDVLITPRPQVILQEFGRESLKLQLLLWIEAKEKQFQIKSDLCYRIEANLRRYQIKMAIPQQDIYLKSPQIEQWFKAWLIQQGFDFSNPVKVGNTDWEITEGELGVNWLNNISPSEIEELIREMRGTKGLPIKEHREKMNIYPCSFIGSQAVDWLVKNYNCTRSEAIALGQILVEKEIIHHVLDQYGFLDGNFFYRFYADEKL